MFQLQASASAFVLLKHRDVRPKLFYWKEKPHRKVLEGEMPQRTRDHEKENQSIPVNSKDQDTDC